MALLFVSIMAGVQTAHAPRSTSPKGAPTSFKLMSVAITGTMRYSTQDVISASGLQVGQTVREEDFQEATRRLGESGAFDQVSYKYEYSSLGAKLQIQVADAKEFVPVRFENFVWFNDQDLRNTLRTRVPLFKGELPLNGNLPDQVSEALQALVAERNIPGQADYLRFTQGDGPVEAFIFSVSGPTIRIRDLEFPGAGTPELPLLQAAGKKLNGHDYSQSILRIEADQDFRPVYLERGYLKASFSEAQPKVVEQNNQNTIVDVAFSVNPGQQYKVTEIDIAGAKIFPKEQLSALIRQKTGTPANTVQLQKDIQKIQKLYGTRGYMAAMIHELPQMDDVSATVKYELKIDEGNIFHMGDLDLQGLDPPTIRNLRAQWRLQAGDIYDSGYPAKFLAAAYPIIGNEWNPTVHETLNRDDTVDLTIRFDPRRSY
jgi:outer membrane protein assembly factor BamA